MKRLLLVFFVICGFLLSASAQQKSITGIVTSADDGLPVIGATIQVKGTTTGAATNLDGRYTIQAAEGQVLVFKYTGLKAQEITVGSATTVDVTMQPDLLNLEEVVVVAYGVQKREAKTGSVGEVKSNTLQDIPETSIDRMLGGKVAGVMVTATSGQPGANTEVRIRGTGSINAGNQPLYVIDGIVAMSGDQSYFTNSGNALATLNPNDVESVSILKDAAAASIYGSRAANGVILITTKSGKTGKSKINFRTSTGMEMMANDNNYGVMSPEQFLTFMRTAVQNRAVNNNPDDPANTGYYFPLSLLDGNITDWMDELIRNGMITNAELSVEGGTERTSAYISGTYENHEGIFDRVSFEKFQFRSNVDHKVNDKVKIGARFNGAYTDASDVPMQALYYANPLFAAMTISPFIPIKNADGSYNLEIPKNAYTNPAANAVYEDQWEKQYRGNANMYLSYDVLKSLSLKTINSIEFTDGEGRRYWSPKTERGGELGTVQVSKSQYVQLTTSNTLTFNKSFGNHNLSFIGGQEATQWKRNAFYVYSPNVDPNIPFPTTSPSAEDDADYEDAAYTLLSFFGVLNYNLGEKYYLQASVREDGSSRFGADNRWGTFWSVGGSWNVSKEDFLKTSTWINQLKLRASYGLSGNFEIGNYEHFGLYGSAEYDGTTGMIPIQPSNPALGWEESGEYNVGLDFALLDRVQGSFDVYSRTTNDMLLDYPLSLTSGFGSITTNVGTVNNFGIEALISVNVIAQKDFKWDISVQASHNKSEIMDLGKDEQFVATNTRLIHKVGERLYSFYLYDYAGVNPANGEALWYNADGQLTNSSAQARRIIAGSPEPKLMGGATTTLAWKGLSLDVNFEFATGHQVVITENRYLNSDGFNWNSNHATTQLDYWKQPGDITRNPKPVADNSSNGNQSLSTRWMYDADYLRINNLTLSYSLPKSLVSKLRMQNLRIYGSASNLYTFHNVDFFDPDRGVEGSGAGIYPKTKKFIAGLEISF